MNNIDSLSIKYHYSILSLLNQQKLPHSEEWRDCHDLPTIIDAIKTLKVRGAPAIGIAAVLFLASMAEKNESIEKVRSASKELRLSRPTAVNLMNYLDRIDLVLSEASSDWQILIAKEAEQIFLEDIELCENIAKHGLTILPNSGLPDKKCNILTICNTGGLATAGRGTALGIITKAHETGKKIHAYCCETRPLLQGARLTAWELNKAKVPHTLICDSMAGSIMAAGKIDLVIVGADRIAKNGDFANKIGTYSLAVLAKHHNIPFYVAAPSTTIDLECISGKNIEIEEREPDEVRGFSDFTWSPQDTPVFNLAFDITPAELVTGWILDSGVREEF